MEICKIVFSVSGVETWFFLPPLVSFVISFFTSMAGVSGAFLILPFQMSVLGFTTPSVSSTNFLYNIVGIPGGLTRYIQEKRMLWPLAGWITVGTLPGVFFGYYFRVRYFPDPRTFKFFVGAVLLYLAFSLAKGMLKKTDKKAPEAKTYEIDSVTTNLRTIQYTFNGTPVCISVPAIISLSLVVGVIGGIYGIGGGAIIAPFCVSILRVPVYTVAGAALMGTFITSIAGIGFYSTIALNNGQTAPPDWLLGFLFGIGGLVGMYFGAKCQKYVPEKVIKAILALILFSVAGRYIWQFLA